MSMGHNLIPPVLWYCFSIYSIISGKWYFVIKIFIPCTRTRSFIMDGLLILLSFWSRVIEKIAWDASGERLAVSYRDGDELYKGLIAIFDVKRSPLISTSLMWVQISSLISCTVFFSSICFYLHCLDWIRIICKQIKHNQSMT